MLSVKFGISLYGTNYGFTGNPVCTNTEPDFGTTVRIEVASALQFKPELFQPERLHQTFALDRDLAAWLQV